MTSRLISSSLACVLAISLVASPSIANAQAAAPASTPAPAPAAPTAPEAPAAPAATPAPADTTTDHPSTYTIAQGDSLWTIAHKFGTTVVKLRKLNNLKKGALLHPGQVIKLPAADSDASAK
jgi:LysM repeat protein